MSDIQPTYVLYGSGLNYDDDPRFVKKGDGKERVNVSVSSDGSQGIIKSIKGNERIDVEFDEESRSGVYRCIGTVSDDKDKSIVFFVHNSAGKHKVYLYSFPIGKVFMLFDMPTDSYLDGFFNWTENTQITGDVIDGICYFADDGVPKMFNINAQLLNKNPYRIISSIDDLLNGSIRAEEGFYEAQGEFFYFDGEGVTSTAPDLAPTDETQTEELDEGYIYVVNNDGNYIINNEGEYVIL